MILLYYNCIVIISMYMWVVVKIRVPFWVLSIIRHLLFRVPKKGTLILTTIHVCMYVCMYITYIDSCYHHYDYDFCCYHDHDDDDDCSLFYLVSYHILTTSRA